MSEDYVMVERTWLQELCDDEAAMEREMVPYALIHSLIKDVRRLGQMVMETREEVNRLSQTGRVYGMTAENVFDGSYYDHPAISRYAELYGNGAIKIWGG